MGFGGWSGPHRAGPGGHDEAGQQGDQQRGTGKNETLAMPVDGLHLARTVERPVRAALVEMGVTALGLATDRQLSALPRTLFFFCHAMNAPRYTVTNWAYHSGRV